MQALPYIILTSLFLCFLALLWWQWKMWRSKLLRTEECIGEIRFTHNMYNVFPGKKKTAAVICFREEEDELKINNLKQRLIRHARKSDDLYFGDDAGWTLYLAEKEYPELDERLRKKHLKLFEQRKKQAGVIDRWFKTRKWKDVLEKHKWENDPEVKRLRGMLRFVIDHDEGLIPIIIPIESFLHTVDELKELITTSAKEAGVTLIYNADLPSSQTIWTQPPKLYEI